MKFHYDEKQNALAIRFSEGEYEESDQIADGVVLDYDKDGRIIGIEFLDASRRFPKQFAEDIKKNKLPIEAQARG